MTQSSRQFTAKFNQNINRQVAANQFRLDFLDNLRRATNAPNQLGILHAGVSPAQHLALHPQVPALILADPGPMPGGAARHPWEHLEKAFLNQTDAIRCGNIYITSPEANVPLDILRSMQDGALGMSTRDMRWILQFLLDNYATLRLTDIDEMIHTFKTVLWDTTSDIRCYLYDKRQIMHLLAANHCIMNHRDAYEHAKMWFNASHFTQCWIEHARAHPTLASLNIDHLFDDIIAFRDTSLKHMTTAQAGYHAAAATSTTNQASSTSVADAVAAAMAAYEAKHKPASKSKWKSYCWTHGPSNNKDHTSALCRNPHSTDHKTTATISNRMGGAKHRSE
jgi:hypothetical protein